MSDIDRLGREARDTGNEALAAIYDDMVMYLATIKPEITGRNCRSKEHLAEIRGSIDAMRNMAFRCKARVA